MATGEWRDSILKWASRLLIVFGAAALGWCALELFEARQAQQAARRSLDALAARGEELPAIANAARPGPPGDAGGPDESIVSGIAPSAVGGLGRGTAVAQLLIPRIGLSAVVLFGSDARTLRRGAGLIERSAWPGRPGNVSIVAHRDTFFRPLREIEVGDDIWLHTPEGPLHYRAKSLRVVPPTEISVLEHTPLETLTLITCHPFVFVGHAPNRFVVRAVRMAERSPQVSATPARP
jgi:sortase A